MPDDWPATRIGALIVDAILLALTILHAIYSQCTLRRVRSDSNDDAIVSPFYRFFRLYVTGYTMVKADDAESGAIIAEYRSLCLGACCGCGTKRIDNIPKSTSDRISITPRPWTISEFAFHVLVGCVFGIWVHFLPCIVWTCDWGQGDNEGVRGALWFGLWGAYMLVALVFGKWMKGYQITIDNGNGSVQSCRLGQGKKSSVEELIKNLGYD